jgi:crotonobetainyl-CoA:carnitine CoA-transferase CaiB-like acyl-CoA transferase
MVIVLDLTRLLPGGVATRILADLGFEVIKVEDTELGDYMRETVPEVFNYLNHGKKSISINLKDPRGKEIFYKLVRISKVVITSFRPDVTRRLGIDYETLVKINPKIIYCSITGYGAKGSLLPNHDINCNAYAGIDKVLPVQVADIGSALLSIINILYKLWKDEGGFIDVAMIDASKLFNIMNILTEGNSVLNGDYPCYNIYETLDGKISLGALEPKFWISFCKAIKREDLISRQFDKSAVTDVSKEMRKYAREELMKLAESYDIPLFPVRDLREIKNEFPKDVRGPKKGENTVEILKSLRYTDEEIKKLVANNVVNVSH